MRERGNIKITKAQLGAMAQVMDDDLREQVHAELAPCTPSAFLARYLELDPSFPVNDFAAARAIEPVRAINKRAGTCADCGASVGRYGGTVEETGHAWVLRCPLCYDKSR